MLRTFQRCGWVLLLALVATSGWAYSLWGPPGNGGDAWQTPDIGYGTLPGCEGGDFVGAPKNLGEEYRWNIPTLYYAFDQNFLDYFGSNGVVAVDQVFGMLSNYLSAATLTSWSSNLTEFSLNTTRVNYQAQALQIIDFRAVTMSYMMEELGLADPTEWIWTLRNRILPTGAQCPAYIYDVIQRSFDPITPQPSKYINGTLFTYTILQGDCSKCDDAITFNTPVDPYAVTPTAVASWSALLTYGGYGGFYTGLTRDDMGGLRYLMATNNLNVEDLDANSTVVSGGSVDRTTQQLLTTMDLNLFTTQALTNNDANLQALYPGLLLSGPATIIYTNLVTTNVNYYFKNYPYDPAGTPAHLLSSTTYSTNVAVWYVHNYANVVTNTYHTNAYVTIITTNISAAACGAYSIPGQICTNLTMTTVLTNGVFGDFYLIPSNQCGVSIVATQLINTIYVTNAFAVATNVPATTNVLNQQFSQSLVYSYPQYTFIINPVNCQVSGYTGGVALRQGINQMFFVRHDYDSLLGQYWSPVTNYYTLVAVQGNQPLPQVFRRVIGRPDILITAQDMGFNAAGDEIVSSRTVDNFDTDNVLLNLAGPGTRTGPITFTYNKVGPNLINVGPNFLTEQTAISDFVWGTFDLTTNPPVIFPDGTDITALENQVLMRIVSTNAVSGVLPGATNGVAYPPFTFTGNGGTPPYTWSLAADTASGWPTGITLDPVQGIVSSGTNAVAGTPGIYDITVQMTDAGGRSVASDFTLTVH